MTRNEAFIIAFKEVSKNFPDQASRPTLMKLINMALQHRPPSYFISPRRALDRYKRYLLGEYRPSGLWKELCDDIDLHRSIRPWLSVERAVNYVLLTRRPTAFHISQSTAYRILSSYSVSSNHHN